MYSDEVKKILLNLKDTQTVFFATFDGDYSRVRPVTLIYLFDRFFIATGLQDSKVDQLKKYPNAEFCCMLKENNFSGYIRSSGISRLIEDAEIKKDLFENIGYLKDYFKSPDDKCYCLIEILPKKFEYMKPGDQISVKYKN